MQTLEDMRKKMDVLCVDKVKICTGLEITYNGTVNSNGEVNEADEIIEIPEGAIKLGDEPFKYMTGMKEVRLPDSLANISGSAFNYERLTRLDIPKNVDIIRSNCFNDCHIKEVAFAEDSVLSKIRRNSFPNSRIGKLILPRAYNTVDESAFILSEIDTVVLNAGDVTIKEKAFKDSCVRVIECDSIKSIEHYAFSECTELKSINLEKTEFIGVGAFEQCKMLRRLDLRKCEYIDSNAFKQTTLDIVIMEEQIHVEQTAFQKSVIKRLISTEEVYYQLKQEAEILDWIHIRGLRGE